MDFKIEDLVLSNAMEIARQYHHQYVKYKHPIKVNFFLDKKNKWWKYFYETADLFSRREEWDCSVFVKSQFDKKGMIYPPQLITDDAWDTYLEYGYRNIDEDEELSLAKELLSGVKALNKKTVEEFLNEKNNIIRFYGDNYNFNIRFFCFSKTFCDFYEDNENKFDKPININNMRIRVRQYPKLIEAIKNKLGEDYYDVMV